MAADGRIRARLYVAKKWRLPSVVDFCTAVLHNTVTFVSYKSLTRPPMTFFCAAVAAVTDTRRAQRIMATCLTMVIE